MAALRGAGQLPGGFAAPAAGHAPAGLGRGGLRRWALAASHPQHKLQEARETWATRQSTALVFAGVCVLLGVGMILAGTYLDVGEPQSLGDLLRAGVPLGMVLSIGAAAAVVGSVPGMVARKRRTRNYSAINALGYAGLLTLGLTWLAALIWALADSTEPD